MATLFNLPKRYSLEDYTEKLVSLLPDGMIWIYDRFIIGSVIQDTIEDAEWQDGHDYDDEVQDTIAEGEAEGHLLRRLLSCFASELDRFETACWSLVNQTDPLYATDLLPDWERVLGLPESCYTTTLTVEERQQQAHAKFLDTFKTTNEQFYIDLAATLGFTIVVEEIPEGSQPRRMGVARMNLEPMGNAGGNSILQITIVSGTGDTDLLICMLNKYKQAHVTIVWVIS